jgi:ubiquinone/menaquinone biosynthesis C-methylase UbiE
MSKNINVNTLQTGAQKAYKGLPMEGLIATWYANITRNDMRRHKLGAEQWAKKIAPGSRVLEVAPGPGYFSIELARLGDYQITGLDISKSFVEIARKHATEAGVNVDFREGNASEMPFESDTFDFIICQAAFKNFTEPVKAIREMHRVLKPGGKAVILDLRGDASHQAINEEVKQLRLNRINTFITKWTFRNVLLKNAYTKAEIKQFISQTDFIKHEILEDNVGMEIRLEK